MNPLMFIIRRRFDIPNEMNASNPGDIIQYLINSGQVSQGQVNQMNLSAKNDPRFRDRGFLQQMLGRR